MKLLQEKSNSNFFISLSRMLVCSYTYVIHVHKGISAATPRSLQLLNRQARKIKSKGGKETPCCRRELRNHQGSMNSNMQAPATLGNTYLHNIEAQVGKRTDQIQIQGNFRGSHGEKRTSRGRFVNVLSNVIEM